MKWGNRSKYFWNSWQFWDLAAQLDAVFGQSVHLAENTNCMNKDMWNWRDPVLRNFGYPGETDWDHSSIPLFRPLPGRRQAQPQFSAEELEQFGDKRPAQGHL